MSDNLEIFEGFKISYPEYSVTTPQTLKEFTVRSLTLSEEEKLQNSALTVAKLSEHLSSCIWQCISKKPDDIQTEDDFFRKTTLRDREALLFGIYHITYGDTQTYSVQCSACQHSNSFKIDMSKAFSVNPWGGEVDSVLEEREEVEFDQVEGVKAIIKQPTIKEEKEIYEDQLFQLDENQEIALEVIIVEKFEQTFEDGTIKEIKEPENILKALRQLPSPDHKKLLNVYYNKFGKYRIDLQTNCVCQNCARQERVDIELTSQFFRAIWSQPIEESE